MEPVGAGQEAIRMSSGRNQLSHTDRMGWIRAQREGAVVAPWSRHGWMGPGDIEVPQAPGVPQLRNVSIESCIS